VGLNRAYLHQVRTADPEFDAAWADAQEQFADSLRDEWRRRIREGSVSEKDIVFMGALTGETQRTREFSDTVLLRELQRLDSTYRTESRIQVDQNVSGAVSVVHAAMADPQQLYEVLRVRMQHDPTFRALLFSAGALDAVAELAGGGEGGAP